MLPLPKKFFVTSGSAISSVSDLNAFDKALIKAGIAELNLVAVSSILPEGIEEINKMSVPEGSIVHCVLSQMRGGEGELISAGIAYGFRSDGKGGYVSEGHIHGSKSSLEGALTSRIEEMAKLRGVRIERVKRVVEEVRIPVAKYGACISALVYLV